MLVVGYILCVWVVLLRGLEKVSKELSKQPYRPVLDLPTPGGWKAELTLVLVIYRDGFYLSADSHPSRY